MLVSVTAPRKGMGQTLTAINIAAALLKLSKGKIMLVDVNRHCNDVGNYLSDTKITKGLDDFICLYNSNLLDDESFETCMKTVNNIDIMASNQCLEIDKPVIKKLLDYTSSKYKTVIVDTISGNNPISQSFFKYSDFIVVVLNQSKHTLDLINSSEQYKAYKNKLLFVVNRYIDRFEDKRINLNLKQITSDIRTAGYDNAIFPLSFDLSIINECNEGQILNRILNKNNTDCIYSNELYLIAGSLLGSPPDKILRDIKSKRNKLLSMFGIKGAASFATRL